MSEASLNTPKSAAAAAGRAALTLLAITARVGWRVGRMATRTQALKRELGGVS
jgi:hypothetical protein